MTTKNDDLHADNENGNFNRKYLQLKLAINDRCISSLVGKVVDEKIDAGACAVEEREGVSAMFRSDSDEFHSRI